jgi:hypothetical protein
MNKQIISFLSIMTIVLFFSSCSSTLRTMREPNTRVNLVKNDFTLSEQVTSEATTTKILMIDFARIFNKQMGVIEGGQVDLMASIPVIGGFISDKTESYALHEMMKNNKGYDVVFYPQYEKKVNRPILGMGFLFKKTTVKATARLGKLN